MKNNTVYTKRHFLSKTRDREKFGLASLSKRLSLQEGWAFHLIERVGFMSNSPHISPYDSEAFLLLGVKCVLKANIPAEVASPSFPNPSPAMTITTRPNARTLVGLGIRFMLAELVRYRRSCFEVRPVLNSPHLCVRSRPPVWLSAPTQQGKSYACSEKRRTPLCFCYDACSL